MDFVLSENIVPDLYYSMMISSVEFGLLCHIDYVPLLQKFVLCFKYIVAFIPFAFILNYALIWVFLLALFAMHNEM